MTRHTAQSLQAGTHPTALPHTPASQPAPGRPAQGYPPRQALLLSVFLTAALTLLLLAAPVNARLVLHTYTNDFALTTPTIGVSNACSCEEAVRDYLVENTGNFVTEYHATLDTTDDFYTFSPQSFTLLPGERALLTVRARPPCGWTGRSTSTLTVTSAFGRQRALTQELEFLTCQNVQLLVEGPSNTSVLAPAVFTVRIRNVADFPDNFYLTVDLVGAPDAGRLSFDADRWAPLAANEERIVHVTYTPQPDDDGPRELLFTVTSERNQQHVRQRRDVMVRNDYSSELLVPKQQSICSRVTTTVPVTLRNTYGAENSFTLTAEGPSFLVPLKETLTLGSGEERNVSLTFTPAPGEEGQSTVRVRAVALHGENHEQTLSLTTEDCYAFALAVDNAPACCGPQVFTLNIRNDGRARTTYALTIDGPSWLLPGVRTITLAPHENANIQLFATIPCVDATHEFTVTATDEASGVTQTLPFTITSHTPQSCAAVTIEPSRVQLTPETRDVTFRVRHEGIRPADYTLVVDSRLFNSSPQAFALAPGEERLIHVQPALGTATPGTYEARLILQAPGARYEHEFSVELRPVPFTRRAARAITTFLRETTPCFWLAVLLVFSSLLAFLALLRALLRRVRRWSAHTLFLVRITLLAGLFLTLLVLGFLAAPRGDALVLSWPAGEQHVVNLSHYFVDPDNDQLTFTAQPPHNVTVTIDGELAILTPPDGFTGWDEVVFTARDPHGAVTDSPPIQLYVDPGLSCLQLNLWLLALLLFVLLLTAMAYRPRPARLLVPPPRPPKAPKTAKTTKRAAKRTATRAARTARRAQHTPHRRAPLRETVLVASKYGDKVHDPQCVLARRIPKQNRIGFSNKAAAVKKGYIPCRVCQPFDN